MNPKKLFVGNLPFNTSDQDLNDIFTQIGPVTSAKVIIDRYSGRSKGFGFVEMQNEPDAQKAIDQFHGAELHGRPVTVNVAKPMEESRPQRMNDMFRERGPRW